MDLRGVITVPKAAPRIVRGLFSNSTSYNPLGKRRRASRLVIRAASLGDHQYDSDNGMVDESMIVLRKRIHELQSKERKNDEPPEEWMEWEKKLYPAYISNVFHVVGWLQYLLITSRPSVAVAIFSFMSVCVPTSVFFVTLSGVKCLGELWQSFS